MRFSACEDASSCRIYSFVEYTDNAATPNEFMVYLDGMDLLGVDSLWQDDY